MTLRQAWKIYRNGSGSLVRGNTLARAKRRLCLPEPAFWPYSRKQGKAFMSILLSPPTFRDVYVRPPVLQTPAQTLREQR
jgi:hypothetical protein